MKVNFKIHGLSSLVEGVLDLGETPVPAIGWELYFDAAGWYRVFEIQGFYSALGRQSVGLSLLPIGELNWTPEEYVEFFRINDDLTAFSKVELGDWCRCQYCPAF